MMGTIIGDIIGSRFEWDNKKTKEFELFTSDCKFTDDTVMTIAVLDALQLCSSRKSLDLTETVVERMRYYGNLFPNAGYGGMFRGWLFGSNPKPYGSFGNGSAMRISPVIHYATDKVHLFQLVDIITNTTHNHPEGIKGARAIAYACYLARLGAGKESIRREIIAETGYDLNFSLASLTDYKFDTTCQGSVPQAIVAFLEAESFEDTIRNAVSIGGDSDTIAAMAGSIAEQFYGIPEEIQNKAMKYLPSGLKAVVERFKGGS
jgi:ADP-ribosylglycohydrolase